jgi:hypothetical protein
MKTIRSAQGPFTVVFAIVVATACGSDTGAFAAGTPDGGGVVFGTGGAAAGAGGSAGAGATGTQAGGVSGAAQGRGGTANAGAPGTPGCSGANCGVPNPNGKPANEPCTSPTECLTGRCEPANTGVAGEICLGACFADGVACTRALDCCSTGCHGGVCGSLCTLEGENCDADADCCSNICNGGRCDIDRVNRDCRPTGEDCTSGTGRDCCNSCNEDTGRCDFGPGTCFGQGVACTAGSQCCNGSCINGVCRAPCAANGTDCTVAADCCSVQCLNGQCAPPGPPPGAGGASGAGGAPAGGAGGASPPVCTPTAERCTQAGDCCSAICFGGFCEPPLR